MKLQRRIQNYVHSLLRRQELISNILRKFDRRLVPYAFIGLFLLVAIPFTLQMESANTSFRAVQHILEWNNYNPVGHLPPGHLYELKNAVEGIRVYIATDVELSSQSYIIENGWTITLLSENTVWNPRVCTTMPSIISPNGDVVMLNTERDTTSGRIMRNIFWFKNAPKEVIFADIDAYRYIGRNLFLNKDKMPYYFNWKNGFLLMYTLDLQKGVLYETQIEQVSEGNKIRIMRSPVDHTPLIGIYDMTTLIDNIYVLQNEKLIPYTEASKKSDTSPKDYILSDHLDGVTSIFTPGKPYETEVLYKQKKVFSFIKEAQVYSYVLGSYQVNR